MTNPQWKNPGRYYIEWSDPSIPLYRPSVQVDAKTAEHALSFAVSIAREHHPGMKPTEWIVRGPFEIAGVDDAPSEPILERDLARAINTLTIDTVKRVHDGDPTPPPTLAGPEEAR